MCVQKACSVVFTHAIYIVRNATFAYHTSIWIMNCKTGSCLCIQIISSEARTSMGLDCERAKKLFEILLPLTRDVWTRFHYVAGSVCAQTTIFHSTFRFSLSLFFRHLTLQIHFHRLVEENIPLPSQLITGTSYTRVQLVSGRFLAGIPHEHGCGNETKGDKV